MLVTSVSFWIPDIHIIFTKYAPVGVCWNINDLEKRLRSKGSQVIVLQTVEELLCGRFPRFAGQAYPYTLTLPLTPPKHFLQEENDCNRKFKLNIPFFAYYSIKYFH